MAELHCIGQVSGASGFDDAGALFCKFRVVAGDNWRLLEGLESGQTHVDYGNEQNGIVWSHPIDVHYAMKSVHGWPKLHVQVWSLDSLGRSSLAGYGFCHVPAQAGQYELECPTWRPAGSVSEQLYQFFLGGAPQLRNEDLVLSTADRCRLSTVSAGIVHFSIGVISKDLARYGVHTGA